MTNKKIINLVKKAQKDEITSFHVYNKLAKKTKDPHNSKILTEIAEDEKKHYNFWKNISKEEVNPNRLFIWIYYWIVRLFGLTFGLKLMERGEVEAQGLYSQLIEEYPESSEVLKDEEMHEEKLINMLDEDFLLYISSIILGLSDAIVELTGALAGLTLALRNIHLIAIIGFVTGISAALSMGASE